jgi:anti-sigma-K factor RskA
MTEPRMTHDQARDLAAGYVLGALERSEEAAVRDHLATCGEPHPEFEAMGGVVPALLELDDLVLVEPPATLGDRIMAAAAADLAERARAAGSPDAERTAPVVAERTTTAAAAPTAFPTAAERAARGERTRTSRLDWGLRIAAVIAIVAVGAWGLNLRGQLDAAQGQLATAQSQLAAAQRFDSAVAAVIQAAGQPGAKPVVLAAAEGSKANGLGAVRPDGSVVLAMRDLPATSGSQVYEAWVIVGEDAPIAVGGFPVDPSGTASFTSRPATTPAGAVIALTLEPNEGSTAPTGPIVSVGTALEQPSS